MDWFAGCTWYYVLEKTILGLGIKKTKECNHHILVIMEMGDTGLPRSEK